MAIRDLIPWNRGQRDLSAARTPTDPFALLHREIDGVFDAFMRGFGTAPYGAQGFLDGFTAWPSIDVSENDAEVEVVAELPGLDQKDVDIQLADGALIIRGEKKAENGDGGRTFRERFHGRFERRVPVEDVDEEHASATFKNGVLTVKLPKLPQARSRVKRVPINTSH